ncbi:MAG: hypothetical protein ABI700_12055, partial [Chloroflexota bacterium]
WLGVGNDPSYSSSRTFETFPFPFVPGQEDFSDARVQAISAAAKALHEERDAWLNPPVSAATGSPDLKDRTLTNLYNALQAYRSLSPGSPEGNSLAATGLDRKGTPSDAAATGSDRKGTTEIIRSRPVLKPAAAEFAPRLAQLHHTLDGAVVAAYGWDASILREDEAILRGLLALNQAKNHA